MKVLKAWGEALEQSVQNKQDQVSRKQNKFELYEKTMQEMSSFYPVLKQKNGDKDMI